MSIFSVFKSKDNGHSAATYTPTTSPPTSNPKVLKFVEEAKALFKPENVVWCDGSKAEYQAMLKALVDGGTALWLNPEKRPELDPRALRPARRRTRRGPDLHLLAEQGRRRPDQQLVRSGRDEGDAVEAV